MVSGKPSNRSAQGVDIPPTTRNLVFRTPHRRAGVHSAADVSASYSYAHCRRTFRTGGQEYSHVVALQAYVLHFGSAYGPTVACGGTDPRVGMKGKRLLRNHRWMLQACELGLPCMVGNSFQNRPFLTEIETA
jgi:hypothetical protein